MRYFKHEDAIYGVDVGQEFLIQPDWVEISYEEVLEFYA